MVSAALLLPNHAFAGEKEPPAQKQQKSSIQEVLKDSVKAKRDSSSGKNKAVHEKPVLIPEPASIAKAGQTLKATKGQAISSINSAGNKNTLTSKINKKVPSIPKGTVKNGKVPRFEEGGPTATKKLLLLGKESANKVKVVKNEQQSLTHKANFIVVKADEKKKSTKRLRASNKVNSVKLVITSPKKENRVPDIPKENPASKFTLSPSQPFNPSAGKSKDRSNLSNLSFSNTIDKWMEWNSSYENTLILPYVSRIAMISNQWMNAPPSPPPQISSL
jgi:hypothetical protein